MEKAAPLSSNPVIQEGPKAEPPVMVDDVESGKELQNEAVHADYNQHKSAADKALLWRQDIRIMPITSLSNIGNAKVLNADERHDLLSETNMTNYQYTIALMVFLIAYTIFEVPSNYLLKKVKPSRWISFLMFSWGAITIGLGGSHNFATVTAVRFLLGIFEAGLFPGLIYYFTFWYRSEERSLRVGVMIASATLAGAFGGAIAYGVGYMNGTSGMSAWRWLFILEGIPSCASAVFIWFALPDYPETASWLSSEEKALAADRLRLDGSQGGAKSMTWKDAKETLTDWRLYLHYALYFGISAPYSALSLFAPSITAGLNYKGLKAQLMTVPPYAVAYVVTVAVAWSADHFNARALHSACLATIGAAGFLASATLAPDAYLQRYGCLIVATSGTFSCIPPLLGWLSSNMFNTAATGLAIALNVSFGAPGQITGVWIYKAEEKTKGYPTGHFVNAGLLFFVAVGGLALRFYYRMLNRKTLREGGDRFYVY
ncbi:putative transporter [Lasiodiplodia theobromae]|uniref:Putative transporter n=1 Tax=Lasiodiplodia theobromae TaxID=45133 RepID=A0A5N5D924_9PEZI|nr:putative transporter [Lasiodiplodia theobromae]